VKVVGAAIACGLLLVQATAATGSPNPPPPKAPGAVAPPPAWLETARSDRWLAYSSFCWRTACVDFIPPAMRPELPRIPVRLGETVQFHLRFRLTSLKLTVGGRQYRLPARRTASWRVVRSGLALLQARAASGSASYAARLVVPR
jgi:hypothetical protein